MNDRSCRSMLVLTTMMAFHSVPTTLSATPIVPGFDVSVYANVTDPTSLSFTSSGILFVGRDARGSGGGGPSAAKIHRVGLSGFPVTEYGAAAIGDPDAVLVDPTGAFSAAGSVLVGGLGSGIKAIRPDQSVTTVFAASPNLVNPQSMAFDGTGRLVISDTNAQRILVSSGATPSTLVSLGVRPSHIAIDAVDRIFLTSESDGSIRVYDSSGALVDASFATGLNLSAPIAFGPGGAWGNDLYAMSGGQLLRFSSAGDRTVVGTGFPTFAAPDLGIHDIEFGPNGALYVTDFDNDRILQIAPVPEPATCVVWSVLAAMGWAIRAVFKGVSCRADLGLAKTA